MKIPPEIILKSIIKPGSVYYFPSEKLHSDDSHYHVVINLDPFNEETIILVCGSSKIQSVRERNIKSPAQTLIEVTPAQYPAFTQTTIFDCNGNVFEYPINDLVQRLSSGHLEYCKRNMPLEIVQKMREGVIASNVIESRIKQQLTLK